MRSHPDPSHADDCFGCKLHSVSFGYGPQGRQAFHGDHPDGGTIRERRDRMVAEARAKGIEPQPAGVRWV